VRTSWAHGGDFTTAPESSVLFGACVAGACVSVFDALDAGAGAEAGDFDIVELGAGSGRLACDVLATLAARDRLPRRYRILEVSASLRERQCATLAALPESIATRVEWIDVPPQGGWRGVLLANEVLDALPFERVRYEADGRITELGVGWGSAADEAGARDPAASAGDDAGGPVWRERPAGERLAAEALRVAADLPQPPAAPYTTDLCRMAAPWIAGVTGALRQGATGSPSTTTCRASPAPRPRW
jgi:SAM-dependent MidA family methyltransferase